MTSVGFSVGLEAEGSTLHSFASIHPPHVPSRMLMRVFADLLEDSTAATGNKTAMLLTIDLVVFPHRVAF